MDHQTKLKLRLRGRLRTTTKLAILFGVSSIASITIALVYFFNFSNVKTLYGTDNSGKVVNGRMEVVDDVLASDFEVKELDATSPTMANDTVVLYRKMKP